VGLHGVPKCRGLLAKLLLLFVFPAIDDCSQSLLVVALYMQCQFSHPKEREDEDVMLSTGVRAKHVWEEHDRK